eukprot:CCRYP_017812-RA/>CCRYP_017812-RA protein AED:0.38 eAED:0.38 QI:0/-1/0/1/-1/1/1/0/239
MMSIRLFSSLILVQSLRLSSGFSAWLPCHRSLEEDEIIMNSRVVSAPVDTGGSDTIVKLAVYDASGKRVDENSIVWIEDEITESYTSISFHIQVDPSTSIGLTDIQFVVETYPFMNKSQSPQIAPSPPNVGAPSPHVPSATAPHMTAIKVPITGFTATSKGGGVLCDGKRSHARGKTGFVKYDVLTNTLKRNLESDGDGAQTISEIWAGWSENHGKVTLTPKIYFKYRNSANGANEEEL